MRDYYSLMDICLAGEKVLNFSQNISLKNLEAGELRLSAILSQIGIIGEATKRLSKEFRKQNCVIPWKKMVGMRELIFHQYDRVDTDIVWIVIKEELPELLKQIEVLLPKK
jgi:uncharacterized protein with HEPN domain